MFDMLLQWIMNSFGGLYPKLNEQCKDRLLLLPAMNYSRRAHNEKMTLNRSNRQMLGRIGVLLLIGKKFYKEVWP